jgi:hypothetical protein
MNPPVPALPKITAPVTMKGGSKKYITDMFIKYSKPIQLYTLSALILAIVFVKQIPVELRSHASSFIGRGILFFSTMYIADRYSWTNGLLMGVLTLLLLSLSPRKISESFQSSKDDTSLKMIQEKKKWWVEMVLKENPIGIQEETVKTQAVQDSSNTSNSNTSGR